jgi:hypothetical protein
MRVEDFLVTVILPSGASGGPFDAGKRLLRDIPNRQGLTGINRAFGLRTGDCI